MNWDYIVVLAMLATTAAVGALLAYKDHPWLAFFLVLIVLSGIKVKT